MRGFVIAAYILHLTGWIGLLVEWLLLEILVMHTLSDCKASRCNSDIGFEVLQEDEEAQEARTWHPLHTH